MVSTIGNYKSFDFSSESINNNSSKRHELTTTLNGYSEKFLEGYKSKGVPNKSSIFSSYHDKISNILKHGENSEAKNPPRSTKLLNDRRSFYDNYIDIRNKDDSNEYKFR